MEGKNNKGGKRDGAGRKPLPISEKKAVLTLYPSNADLYKFGDKKKMAHEILKFISSYGKEAPVVQIQDLNRQTNIVKPIEPQGTTKSNYFVDTAPKPSQPLASRFEYHKAIILKTETIPQVESAMRAVKADLLNGREKLQLEQIAKEHSKPMYND